MEKQNKPAIRFKGFTDAWEQRKVGEVSESYSGGTPSVGVKEYYGGQIPFIRSAEINSEITELFLTEEGLKNSSARLVAVGDILYALYGATSGEVGRARLKGAINQAILAIKPHTDYDSEYLAQWLRKSKHSIIDTYLQGGQGNLSGTIVKELSVDFPSLKEQKAIGGFFRQLDNLITLHQRKYDKLQVLKKAMLEKMFPKNGSSVPEIRFKGFTDAWEQRKLGEIAVFSKGVGYSKNDLCEEGTPIILYGRLYTKYETCIFDVDTFVKEKAGSVYSKGGEVIVPASGETAEDISIASVVVKPGILLGGDLNIVSPTAEYDSAFLALTISSGATHKYLSSLAQGKSVVHLHNSDIQSVSAKFPTKREQEKIHLIFGKIDTLITLHQRELEKLQNIKKSMLEKMFV